MTRPVIETWPAEAVAPPDSAMPLFLDAELAPHRSLGAPGFAILMLTLCLVSFVAGLVFFSVGAWPVPFFFGLDILLVWVAFRLSYREGRRREFVRIGPDRIAVHRLAPNGAVRHYVLPTAWTQVALAAPGRHDAQLSLTSGGRALVLGSFLPPVERESLADAVSAALAAARRAGARPQEAGGAAP